MLYAKYAHHKEVEVFLFHFEWIALVSILTTISKNA